MRLGLLGGTFDPPHLGHLVLGESSRGALNLDYIFYIPVALHPHKLGSIIEALPHRMAMLRLSVQGNPYFSISHVDVDRPGPHYSVDTIKLIKQAHPRDEIFFIIGGDNFYNILTFMSAHNLVAHANLAVIKRAGEEITIDMHDGKIPGLSKKVHVIDTPILSAWLSSSVIRQRIANGVSIRYLVSDSVLDYIHEKKLYGWGNE